MKKLILTSMLMWILPLGVFAMTCNSASLADGSNEVSGPSALDNGTINNCLDLDVAAWAISKVYYIRMLIVQQGSR